MATKETDLERQKREAAEQDSFNRWREAYRAEQGVADQWGGGLINGVPAAVAVDASQVESLPMNPQGDIVNPNQLAVTAESIAARGDVARREAQAPKINEAYNQFLGERGISPSSIGGAELVTRPDGSKGMLIPSIKDQEEAQQLNDQLNRLDSRDRIAARRMERRGQYGEAAGIRNQLDVNTASRGGKSSENRLTYAQNLLNSLRPVVAKQMQIENSNGFAPSYDPSNPYINSTIPQAPLSNPRPARYDWSRFIS